MFGWYVQETQVGGRPAAINLATGAYFIISEADLGEPNQITSDEISALTSAPRSCPGDALTYDAPLPEVIHLRLYRFGMVDRAGGITEEGETALAHITFERSGITAFASFDEASG